MGRVIHNMAQKIIDAIENLVSDDLSALDAMAIMVHLSDEAAGMKDDRSTKDLFDHIRLYLRNKHYPHFQTNRF